MLTRVEPDDPAQPWRPSRAEIEEYREEERRTMAKLKFGDPDITDCVKLLQNPDLLAKVKENLEANRATWCMPVQFRHFDEETIRAAVGRVERG
jgi:hypothetical protein